MPYVAKRAFTLAIACWELLAVSYKLALIPYI